MRNIPPRILVLSAFFAASVASTAIVPVVTPAIADPDSPASYRAEFDGIRQEMRELWLEMHNFQPLPKYCLPPIEPMKAPHNAVMQSFDARTRALVARYLAMKQSLSAFLAGNHRLEVEFMIDGLSPRDRRYWQNSPFEQEKDRLQRKFNEKNAELKAKRERNCNPPAPPKKEIEVIGGNPPVQPPPPPPPPPPVDPLKGLTRPVFEAVNIPRLDDHYCSQAEKNAALAKVPPEIAKAEAQIAEIDAYIAAVQARKGELKQRGVEQHWLDSMDYEVRQAEFMRNDRRTTIESINTTRRLIEQTPIVDCSGDKRIGSIGNGGTGVSVAPTLYAGNIVLPKFTFIGLEHPVSQEQIFGIEGLEDREWVRVASVDFSAILGTTTKPGGTGVRATVDSLHIGVTGYDAELSGSLSEIDPLGYRLLLPGSGEDGAPFQFGLSLGAGVPLDTPGGANVVENMRYSYTTESDTFYGKYARTWICDDGALTGYGGVGYSRMNQYQWLAGDIPGYATEFSYWSRTYTDVFRVIGGARVDYPLRSLPSISLSAGVTGFVNFADAQGEDYFEVDGFTDQEVEVGKNETTFGANLSASINWEFAKGAKIGVGLNYTYDETTPVIIRDGNTPSRVEFEPTDMYLGSLGTRFTF